MKGSAEMDTPQDNVMQLYREVDRKWSAGGVGEVRDWVEGVWMGRGVTTPGSCYSTNSKTYKCVSGETVDASVSSS